MFSHPRGAFSTLIHETICHISEEFSASLLIVWGLLMKSSRRGLFFYDGLSPWTDFECSHNGRRWISFHFFCRSSPYWTKMLMETFHFVMMYSTNVFSLLFVTFHQFAIFSFFFSPAFPFRFFMRKYRNMNNNRWMKTCIACWGVPVDCTLWNTSQYCKHSKSVL